MAKGFLDVLSAAVMRRGVMAAEAEIRWHDELDAALAEAGDGAVPARIAGGSALGLGEGSFDVTTPRRAAPGTRAEEHGAAPAGEGRQDSH